MKHGCTKMIRKRKWIDRNDISWPLYFPFVGRRRPVQKYRHLAISFSLDKAFYACMDDEFVVGRIR
jgi:hypothetical protein